LTDIPESLRRILREAGVRVAARREIDHGTQYRLVRDSEEAILNIYRTKRVLVQGKASGLKDLLESWKTSRASAAPSGRETARPPAEAALDPRPRVGVDEAGKGDYFGPLVVAGVRVSGEEAALRLQEIGVRDSKALGNGQALSMADRIVGILGESETLVVSLSPEEYERRREAAGNVNRLLGEIDVEIIRKLKGEVNLAVVDEFARAARSYLEPVAREGVRLEVRTRAEDDAAVAAASILARARYLEEMRRLSEWVGFELPRGSTHVREAARRVVEELGEEGLRKVAKVHFATTAVVLGAGYRETGDGA
jgi:ribonuclease HIII